MVGSHMFAQVTVANWKSTMKLQGQYFHCKFGLFYMWERQPYTVLHTCMNS